MFFDILLLLLIVIMIMTQTWGVDIEIPLARGQTMFTYKLRFLQKIAVLGLAILLIFEGRVSQMFFETFFLLLVCNNNIDSDPGVDIEIPLTRGQKLGQFKNSFFLTSSFEFDKFCYTLHIIGLIFTICMKFGCLLFTRKCKSVLIVMCNVA